VNRRRRIQPKAALELETVSLRLPAQLVRTVDQYAKHLGGSTDRTHVITQAIEIALAQDADFQKTLSGRAGAPAAGPVRVTA
jgi:metal-responsive CopG/Arc/MetJ family transcriptional regulator